MSELTGICQTCGGIVTPADGALWIDHNEIRRYRTLLTEWEGVEGRGSLAVLSVAAAAPRKVAWRVTHNRCIPADANAYVLVFPRSSEVLLHLLAHVDSKSWFACTTIADLLREAADRTGRFACRPVDPQTGEDVDQ